MNQFINSAGLRAFEKALEALTTPGLTLAQSLTPDALELSKNDPNAFARDVLG